jgi:hypothetical protein
MDAKAASRERIDVDARKVGGLDPLQPAGSEPAVDLVRCVPRNFIRHCVRDEDPGVELTEQVQPPDPREVDQRCGVADRLQGSSDASSSSNSSAVSLNRRAMGWQLCGPRSRRHGERDWADVIAPHRRSRGYVTA